MDNDKIVSLLAEQYQYAASTKDQLGMLRSWQLAERFWQADQWPAGTPASFPKPVLNIVHEHVERKVAAVTGAKPKITYIPRRLGGDPEQKKVLDQAAQWTADRIRLIDLLDDVARTAALMGTGIAQTSFDPDARGGSQKHHDLWQGDLECKEIDPENFFPGDPVESDVQRQPFIMVAETMQKQDCIAMYQKHATKHGVNIADLAADGSTDSNTRNYPQENVRRQNTVYVVRSWWREKGKLNYAVAAQGRLLRFTPGIYEHGRYPFTVLRWYKRRKSFWGLSEFAQLLPNQQSINRLLAFLIQSAELTGMPQKRAKYQAVKPGAWTNEPGLILTDMSAGQGWGIDYLQPPTVPPYVMGMVDMLLSSIRRQQGLTDAVTGRTAGAQLNATAIAYLQQAAMVLLQPIIERANTFLEDLGRLWFAFWTEPDLFSTGRMVGGSEFRGSDFVDEEFDVKIESGAVDFWTEQQRIEMIFKLLAAQIITPQEVLFALPESAFPQKEIILQQRQEAEIEAQAAGVMPVAGMQGPAEAGQTMPETAQGQDLAQLLGGAGLEAGLGGGQAG